MARFYNKFEFVGNIAHNNDLSKVYVVDTFDSGAKKHKLNISIRQSNTNAEFLKLEALLFPAGRVFKIGKDGKNIDVAFENRSELLPMVADWCKLVVDLETDENLKKELSKLRFQISSLENKIKNGTNTSDEVVKLSTYVQEYEEKLNGNRHEFIHEYDLINFLLNNLNELSKHKVRVLGNIECSEWKGKVYTSYIPTLIEVVPEDTPTKLEATMELYFNKNSLDESLLKETGKIVVDAYLCNRDSKAKGDRFFQKTFVIQKPTLADDADEKLKDLVEKQMAFLPTMATTKAKTYHKMLWKASILNGVETKEFTIDDLTDQQKAMVSLGIMPAEEYKSNRFVAGDRVSETRLFMPVVKDDYKHGVVDTGLTDEDFAELIARNDGEVKKEVKQELDKVEEKDTELEDSFRVLFGS